MQIFPTYMSNPYETTTLINGNLTFAKNIFDDRYRRGPKILFDEDDAQKRLLQWQVRLQHIDRGIAACKTAKGVVTDPEIDPLLSFLSFSQAYSDIEFKILQFFLHGREFNYKTLTDEVRRTWQSVQALDPPDEFLKEALNALNRLEFVGQKESVADVIAQIELKLRAPLGKVASTPPSELQETIDYLFSHPAKPTMEKIIHCSKTLYTAFNSVDCLQKFPADKPARIALKKLILATLRLEDSSFLFDNMEFRFLFEKSISHFLREATYKLHGKGENGFYQILGLKDDDISTPIEDVPLEKVIQASQNSFSVRELQQYVKIAYLYLNCPDNLREPAYLHQLQELLEIIQTPLGFYAKKIPDSLHFKNLLQHTIALTQEIPRILKLVKENDEVNLPDLMSFQTVVFPNASLIEKQVELAMPSILSNPIEFLNKELMEFRKANLDNPNDEHYQATLYSFCESSLGVIFLSLLLNEKKLSNLIQDPSQKAKCQKIVGAMKELKSLRTKFINIMINIKTNHVSEPLIEQFQRKLADLQRQLLRRAVTDEEIIQQAKNLLNDLKTSFTVDYPFGASKKGSLAFSSLLAGLTSISLLSREQKVTAKPKAEPKTPTPVQIELLSQRIQELENLEAPPIEDFLTLATSLHALYQNHSFPFFFPKEINPTTLLKNLVGVSRRYLNSDRTPLEQSIAFRFLLEEFLSLSFNEVSQKLFNKMTGFYPAIEAAEGECQEDSYEALQMDKIFPLSEIQMYLDFIDLYLDSFEYARKKGSNLDNAHLCQAAQMVELLASPIEAHNSKENNFSLVSALNFKLLEIQQKYLRLLNIKNAFDNIVLPTLKRYSDPQKNIYSGITQTFLKAEYSAAISRCQVPIHMKQWAEAWIFKFLVESHEFDSDIFVEVIKFTKFLVNIKNEERIKMQISAVSRNLYSLRTKIRNEKAIYHLIDLRDQLTATLMVLSGCIQNFKQADGCKATTRQQYQKAIDLHQEIDKELQAKISLESCDPTQLIILDLESDEEATSLQYMSLLMDLQARIPDDEPQAVFKAILVRGNQKISIEVRKLDNENFSYSFTDPEGSFNHVLSLPFEKSYQSEFSSAENAGNFLSLAFPYNDSGKQNTISLYPVTPFLTHIGPQKPAPPLPQMLTPNSNTFDPLPLSRASARRNNTPEAVPSRNSFPQVGFREPTEAKEREESAVFHSDWEAISDFYGDAYKPEDDEIFG